MSTAANYSTAAKRLSMVVLLQMQACMDNSQPPFKGYDRFATIICLTICFMLYFVSYIIQVRQWKKVDIYPTHHPGKLLGTGRLFAQFMWADAQLDPLSVGMAQGTMDMLHLELLHSRSRYTVNDLFYSVGYLAVANTFFYYFYGMLEKWEDLNLKCDHDPNNHLCKGRCNQLFVEYDIIWFSTILSQKVIKYLQVVALILHFAVQLYQFVEVMNYGRELMDCIWTNNTYQWSIAGLICMAGLTGMLGLRNIITVAFSATMLQAISASWLMWDLHLTYQENLGYNNLEEIRSGYYPNIDSMNPYKAENLARQAKMKNSGFSLVIGLFQILVIPNKIWMAMCSEHRFLIYRSVKKRNIKHTHTLNPLPSTYRRTMVVVSFLTTLFLHIIPTLLLNTIVQSLTMFSGCAPQVIMKGLNVRCGTGCLLSSYDESGLTGVFYAFYVVSFICKLAFQLHGMVYNLLTTGSRFSLFNFVIQPEMQKIVGYCRRTLIILCIVLYIFATIYREICPPHFFLGVTCVLHVAVTVYTYSIVRIWLIDKKQIDDNYDLIWPKLFLAALLLIASTTMYQTYNDVVAEFQQQGSKTFLDTGSGLLFTTYRLTTKKEDYELATVNCYRSYIITENGQNKSMNLPWNKFIREPTVGTTVLMFQQHYYSQDGRNLDIISSTYRMEKMRLYLVAIAILISVLYSKGSAAEGSLFSSCSLRLHENESRENKGGTNRSYQDERYKESRVKEWPLFTATIQFTRNHQFRQNKFPDLHQQKEEDKRAVAIIHKVLDVSKYQTKLN